ncbi:MAG: hypothetical protein M3301_04165 [Chloroflexota bacterium]|nr:hypothetical protein [Chloroflexota bacterium]
MAGERLLTMRDIVDGQLESVDGRRLARVADARAEWREDGSLWVTDLVIGPEALAGRVSDRLLAVVHRLLAGRFEHAIAISEVEELGPTIRLRGRASDYSLGGADRWIVKHIFRFLPGSGR